MKRKGRTTSDRSGKPKQSSASYSRLDLPSLSPSAEITKWCRCNAMKGVRCGHGITHPRLVDRGEGIGIRRQTVRNIGQPTRGGAPPRGLGWLLKAHYRKMQHCTKRHTGPRTWWLHVNTTMNLRDFIKGFHLSDCQFLKDDCAPWSWVQT
jgi:hypothetical protein